MWELKMLIDTHKRKRLAAEYEFWRRCQTKGDQLFDKIVAANGPGFRVRTSRRNIHLPRRD